MVLVQTISRFRCSFTALTLQLRLEYLVLLILPVSVGENESILASFYNRCFVIIWKIIAGPHAPRIDSPPIIFKSTGQPIEVVTAIRIYLN